MKEVKKEKVKQSYFAVIPADVRYNKKLNANAKLLYGEITALCSKEGYCWASNNYFAELYGCTAQAISNWIQDLVSQNFIKTETFPERGNLRHIYLNLNRNQESFDFGRKQTINNDYRVSNKNGELSNSIIEESNPVIELSNSVITNINTSNNTSNNTSSSSSSTSPPNIKKKSENEDLESLESWIKQQYRHWFSRIDVHEIADYLAVYKAVKESEDKGVPKETVRTIITRAFERVVQEKQKKDWVTREVLVRIRWGVEDYFKEKNIAEAKAKKEEVKQIEKQFAIGWNPKTDTEFQNLMNKTKIYIKKQVEVKELENLDYRRRKSLFDQAVKKGK